MDPLDSSQLSRASCKRAMVPVTLASPSPSLPLFSLLVCNPTGCVVLGVLHIPTSLQDTGDCRCQAHPTGICLRERKHGLMHLKYLHVLLSAAPALRHKLETQPISFPRPNHTLEEAVTVTVWQVGKSEAARVFICMEAAQGCMDSSIHTWTPHMGLMG